MKKRTLDCPVPDKKESLSVPTTPTPTYVHPSVRPSVPTTLISAQLSSAHLIKRGEERGDTPSVGPPTNGSTHVGVGGSTKIRGVAYVWAFRNHPAMIVRSFAGGTPTRWCWLRDCCCCWVMRADSEWGWEWGDWDWDCGSSDSYVHLR